MILRKREDKNLKEEAQIALTGELGLEKSVYLSQDRLCNE